MGNDEALTLARRALGSAANLRVFDPKLGEPGPLLEETVAAIIRERDEAYEAAAQLVEGGVVSRRDMAKAIRALYSKPLQPKE